MSRDPARITRVLAVDLHRDGNQLAAGLQDGTARLWDLHSEQLIHTLEGHANRVWSVAFSPDGNVVASGSSDSTARLWDVKTGASLHELKRHEASSLLGGLQR